MIFATLNVIHKRDNETLFKESSTNFKTILGRDFIHEQSYGNNAQANGLNYIAISTEPVTEDPTSIALVGEIWRTQGTWTHVSGSNLSRVEHVFTASSPVVVQKAALFNQSIEGVMNHVVSFTPRALQINDQLEIEFVISIG